MPHLTLRAELNTEFKYQTGATAFSYFRRKLPHGLLCNGTALAPRERGSRIIQGRQECDTPAFSFFPQGERFAHSFLLAGQPPTLNRLAHERLLIRRELYF